MPVKRRSQSASAAEPSIIRTARRCQGGKIGSRYSKQWWRSQSWSCCMVFVIEAPLVLLLLLSLSLIGIRIGCRSICIRGSLSDPTIVRFSDFHFVWLGFPICIIVREFWSRNSWCYPKVSQLTLSRVVSVNSVGSGTLFCSYHCFCFCTDRFLFFFPSEVHYCLWP